MNVEKTKKILQRIATLETDIDTLKQVRIEIAASGYASATLGSGGGSKSYTRLDLGKISELINSLTEELKGLRTLLGQQNPAQPKSIYHIYF